jgi:hypothetical protein
MVSRQATALTLVFVGGCISMAELAPPVLRPDAPDAEAPPDTFVEPAGTYADTDPTALVDFRPLLARYGTWVDDAAFGTVWVPEPRLVGAGFVPYVTAGHWVYEDDYAWVSDYAWGWVPFHYGRWVAIEGRGWSWIPGRAYAAAWVVWRTSPGDVDYVGWAPMPPAFTWRTLPEQGRRNIGGGEAAVAVAPIIEASFVFCPASNLFSTQVAPWIVAGTPGFTIAKRSEPYTRRESAPDTPLAQAPEHGPAPAELGIPANLVRAPSVEDEGLALAKRYALPTTIPARAHPPSHHWVRLVPPIRLPRWDAPHTYRLTTGLP